MKLIDRLIKMGEDGLTPRVHGNGFIQLNLSSDTRLHIWGHPDIPRQLVPTPIHDHAFSFQSSVIIGVLTNKTYFLEEHSSGEYIVYRAVCRDNEDTVLESMRIPTSVVLQHKQVLRPDNPRYYRMSAYEFHETETFVPTATVMRKSYPVGPKHTPRVLVPRGFHPDNEFNRYAFDPNELWRIIADVLGDYDGEVPA